MKESDIQRSIIDYLEIQEAIGRLFFQRINNTPIWDKNRFRALPKGTKKGFPDILIIKNCKCIGIEVKTEKGRQSEHQKDQQERFIKNGAEYFVVRSLEDLIKILEDK